MDLTQRLHSSRNCTWWRTCTPPPWTFFCSFVACLIPHSRGFIQRWVWAILLYIVNVFFRDWSWAWWYQICSLMTPECKLFSKNMTSSCVAYIVHTKIHNHNLLVKAGLVDARANLVHVSLTTTPMIDLPWRILTHFDFGMTAWWLIFLLFLAWLKIQVHACNYINDWPSCGTLVILCLTPCHLSTSLLSLSKSILY